MIVPFSEIHLGRLKCILKSDEKSNLKEDDRTSQRSAHIEINFTSKQRRKTHFI